jgi:hypothetical protein
MEQQLAKEAALWKNWDYSRSEEAQSHGNAAPAMTAVRQRPLRVRSVQWLVTQPTARKLCSRSQSAAANTQSYTRLQEDQAIINHRTVEDLRTRNWEQAEATLTSAFFLMWALSVVLLGGWNLANQLSASVVHFKVAAAVLAATCTPVAFSRINRQAPDGVPCLVT